jgi:hypothetical protein
MGKYLDIAKKFEARMRAEGKHPSQQGESIPQSSSAPESAFPPGYRALYRKMASNPLFDDFPLIDAWLAEHHPALWRKIRDLDSEITHLEQEGASEATYRAKQEELLSLCRAAQEMRSKSKGVRVLAVHHCGGTKFWLSRYSNLWICEKCNPPGKGSVEKWVEAGEPIEEGVSFVN